MPHAKSATVTSPRKNDYVTSTVPKLPNLNFANIFRHFAKFNARQYFPLYGIYHTTLIVSNPGQPLSFTHG